MTNRKESLKQMDINETTKTTVSKGGAPTGNNNAGKGSQLTAMLRACLEADGRQKMREGVEAIGQKFAEGERWAVEFVFDRLEGKAIARTEITGADGSALPMGIRVEYVDAPSRPVSTSTDTEQV